MIDGFGIYGMVLHYALTLFFVLGALSIFIHLYRKGRLDMDEEPKHQMLNEENPHER